MPRRPLTRWIAAWTAFTFIVIVVLPPVLGGLLLPPGTMWYGGSLGSFVLYTGMGVVLLGLAGQASVGQAGRRAAAIAVPMFSLMTALAAGEYLLGRTLPALERPELFVVSSTHYHHRHPADLLMFQKYPLVPGGEPVPVTRARTNADGLRTSYTAAEFHRHATRIVTLGDSFTFGSFVEADQAYPALLEGLLRESGLDAAVLNAGHISYSPFLEGRLLEGVVSSYRPTHVLLMLDATDIGDDYRYETQARYGPPPGAFAIIDEPPLFLRSSLYTLLRPSLLYPLNEYTRILRPESDYYYFRLDIGGSVEKNRFFIYRHPLTETRPFFDRSYAHIKAIAELSRSMNASFTLLVAPRFHHWDRTACPDNWEADAYGLEEPYQFEYFRFFDEKAAEGHVSIVNLLPAFQGEAPPKIVFDRDPHWNPRGHRFVAETLARLVRERQIGSKDDHIGPGTRKIFLDAVE